MTPTCAQRFFASQWLLRLWFGAIVISATVTALRLAGFRVGMLTDWKLAGLYLVITILAGLLGFMLAIFPGTLILGPLFHARALRNGAPFKIGDTVKIIGGCHDGRITKVYSMWQGDTMRLDIGDAPKAVYQDIFSPTQLIKIQNCEQTGAANPHAFGTFGTSAAEQPLVPKASGDT